MRGSKNSSINFSIKILLFFVIILFVFFIFSGLENCGSILTLAFTGDAIPHYMIRSILDSKGEKGILDAFYFVNKFLKSDAAFFNLETTISDIPKPVKPYHFSAQPIFLSSIIKSGFTHYTIANNHSLDYGEDGFIKTLSFIDREKATGYIENGKFSYLLFEINDFKISFLSFTTLSNYPVDNKIKIKPVYIENIFSNKELLSLLKKLDKESDILIVGVHWGDEYHLKPNIFQIKTAKYLIDNGADIVWGTHPHVVQPFEIYNNKLILYSLGNLISGQAYNIENKESTDYHDNYFYTKAIPVIKVYYDINKKISKLELIPFFQVNNYFVKNKNETFFTTLINTKYFVKDGLNDLNFLFDNYILKDLNNYYQYDTNLLIYLKNKILNKNTIKNIILANNFLYKTFFDKFINNEMNMLLQKIIETSYSYILSR